MHLLVHSIKAAWWRNKVAAVLFLDVEGAFPNAVTMRLLHNLHMHQVPERYVLFIAQLLKDRYTRLKFDGYISDWMGVSNGIVQGDPLSMILYLFYNADLIDDVKKGELKITYVDDVNFYAEGADFEEAYAKLCDMMSREGGGWEWSQQHNSQFEMPKLTLVGFSRCCTPDTTHPGKLRPEPRLDLTIDGTVIKPATLQKFLGVLFDQELCWKDQAERMVVKATKWSLCACQLARPTVSILPWQMQQLYQVMAVPSFTYAADVWFKPVDGSLEGWKAGGSIGVSCKLTSVQCIATVAIMGALHTTATDTMEMHANLRPMELLMHRICHRAAMWLMALPESHPLYKPVKLTVRRDVKQHRSPLHRLLHSFRIKPTNFETLSPIGCPPN